jgi:hypothetical protein
VRIEAEELRDRCGDAEDDDRAGVGAVTWYWDDDATLWELGERVWMSTDEPSQIEHKLAHANGLEYGAPPRHWSWECRAANRRGVSEESV